MITDIPVILELIKELADYEHESDKVLATEESLARTLVFAPSRDGENELDGQSSQTHGNGASPSASDWKKLTGYLSIRRVRKGIVANSAT